MSYCLIYHAIGTLNDDHFKYSIESLKNQNIDWSNWNIVLYNHSDKPNEYFNQYFDKIITSHKILNRKNEVKGAIADWKEQFERITGYDYYFVHKADFYLADGCLKRFEEIISDEPMFVGVRKFDTSEKVSIKTIREMAGVKSWEECKKFGESSYSPEDEPKWDGVMHGYNERARGYFLPTKDELEKRYGECLAFRNMNVKKITDDKIYALHMFHALPKDEREPNKNIKGRRY